MARTMAARDTDQRVRELLETFRSADACAAFLLCDRHPADALAYRIVAQDLSTQVISYGELREESERFSAALRSLGIGPGDRVATLMGKSRSYLVALMGIWRLGAVHVPLFTAFAPPAIAFRLEGSKAKAIICDAAQEAKLALGETMPADRPWLVITTGEGKGGTYAFSSLMAEQQPGVAPVAVGGDSPIIHVYTSGTTGNPKGVIVPLRALASFQTYAEFGQGLLPSDVFWCAADPGWAYGLYFGILSTFTTGTPSILFEGGFTQERTLEVLDREKVTNFAAAPTVYRTLRSSGLRPGALNLRCATSAGEPLTPEVNEWAKAELGVLVHDHYGQTEAGMLINNHHHSAVARPIMDGSMGNSMPGWRAVILEADSDLEAAAGTFGRVAMDLAHSPLAWFNGYDGDPSRSEEKFTPDGRYYITGDTGMVDQAGYFHFSARDDDVIIMAGYRIGPFEVESTIATHPAVAENAVIAVPDAVRGEVIEAFAVLREGHTASADLEKELQQWVKQRFAAHAYPRAIHFVDSMPKTPSGKIQRFVLKQRRLDEIGEKSQ